MYESHFGFSERPFSLTPDTLFFINQESHRDALNTILVALKHCEGFIKVVGEVGTGKTLLSRILLARLNRDFVTAYIPNPFLSPGELKAFVAREIGVEYGINTPSHELMSALYRRLVQHSRNGKQVILIIDEAQAMPRNTVECLRLLSNLETEKRKLLQIVMLGQPELDKLLDRSDLRQLKQRIVFSEKLKPLNSAATKIYVQQRLARVQSDTNTYFGAVSLKLIHLASGGIPRLINILCHKALICAYGRAHKSVAPWHVARAILDTSEVRPWAAAIASILALEPFCPRRESFS